MQLGLKLFGSLLAFSTLFQLSHAITRDDQRASCFFFEKNSIPTCQLAALSLSAVSTGKYETNVVLEFFVVYY